MLYSVGESARILTGLDFSNDSAVLAVEFFEELAVLRAFVELHVGDAANAAFEELDVEAVLPARVVALGGELVGVEAGALGVEALADVHRRDERRVDDRGLGVLG